MQRTELPGASAHGLALRKLGHQRQQAKPRAAAGRLDAVQIDHGLAQHLQPAADAQYPAAPRSMSGNHSRQPLGAQPRQVRGRGLAARQDDPIGAFQLGCVACPDEPYSWHRAQGLELVQVADAWVGDDGNARHALARQLGSSCGAIVKPTVFLGQAMATAHWHHGHGRYAGQLA